jgi:hypothetical protein
MPYLIGVVEGKVQARTNSDFQHLTLGQGNDLLALLSDQLAAAEMMCKPWQNIFCVQSQIYPILLNDLK